MSSAIRPLSPLLVLVAACHGAEVTTAPATQEEGVSDAAPPEESRAPVIVSFQASATTVREGDLVTFAAVVSDPDGLEDIKVGEIFDESGIRYDAFGPSAQDGAFQVTVSWGDINRAAAIGFPEGGSRERKIHVRVTDWEGHAAESSTTIELSCGGRAACAGACVDHPSAEVCTFWSGCLRRGSTPSCAAYCGKGATADTCDDYYAGGGAAGLLTFSDPSCTAYAPGFSASSTADLAGYASVRCCCSYGDL